MNGRNEGNPRRARVAEAMRHALSSLISELHDPRIRRAGLVSVNHIDLNKDMGVACVYLGFCGGEDEAAPHAIVALNAAKGRLRGPLGRMLQLQRAPELRFVHDQSGEFGVRLSEILRDDARRHVADDTEDGGQGD